MGVSNPAGGCLRFTSVVAHPESRSPRIAPGIHIRRIALGCLRSPGWGGQILRSAPRSCQAPRESVTRRRASTLGSSMHGDLAHRAVELAEALLREARAQQTPDEHAQARKLARMMADSHGKELTIALADQAFRSHRPERIADQLAHLL